MRLRVENSMYLYTDKQDCYGCGACENACNLGAIKMLADSEGFLYPTIYTEKCVSCGRCREACQIYKQKIFSKDNPRVFAAKNRDENVREKSTSGGMFSVFAEEIIKNGGAVYGVAHDEQWSVVHERSETMNDCQKFLGSKYAQSKIGETFSQVKQDLLEGKEVLFTGTPCQIAGLSTFLGEKQKTDKLILCEIICHGAPSPLMWHEHISFIEKERKSKVVNYKHRSKVLGWHGHNECFFLENGKKEYKSKLSQNHKDLFYAHLIIRPSCYSCAYTGFPRVADISIADFWGIELCMKEFDDNKGTSLLILNTQKARDLFGRVENNIEYRESNLEDAFRYNHKNPAKMNVNRERFWKDYNEYGYEYVCKKYASYTLWGRAKRWSKIKLKKILKVIGLYKLVHKFTQKKYQKEKYS